MYSDSHKFIFVHIGKCAGTSIKKALASVDGLTHSHGGGHASLLELQTFIKESGNEPEKYFSFSVARNPWDRHVSLYHHMTTITKRYPNNPAKAKIEFHGSFEDFVLGGPPQKFDYSLVNYVIQYENLIEDFDHVCKHLSIQTPILPHIDYNTGRPKINYQSYYNNFTRKKISELYSADIDRFGYQF